MFILVFTADAVFHHHTFIFFRQMLYFVLSLFLINSDQSLT